MIEAYLEEAHRLGFKYLRIIHGKGIGVQREIVRSRIRSRSLWGGASRCGGVSRRPQRRRAGSPKEY